ncbi:MAG: minichromosome maintenance protein MCM [Candidatus Thermoplasmatota archaeon]|nr:minichromosome maintenance protein MCM [Candidatus Thermoplasmatota archaeon]
MTKIIKDVTTVEQWKHLLTDNKYLKPELETAKTNNVFILNFEKVDKANPELGQLLLEKPMKAIVNLEYALEEQELKDSQIEITGLYPIAEKNIADLRTDDLNKLQSIEGIILQITSVNPKLFVGAFQCSKCAAIIKIEQNEEYIKQPTECYEDQGGCGRISDFHLLTSLSKYIDFQKMLITNPYYEPYRRELEVHCYKTHCNRVLPGETITINGQYSINQQQKQLTQETFFHTYGFEKSHSKNLEFITVEESEKSKKLKNSEDLWLILIKSFAPSVYGHIVLKESLLLQQLGGVWYDLLDGITKRGSIHILLVGDPGTVKSSLMQASAAVAPIFTKASGRGATAAGITAGAVKDPLGEGWILQAGALVRANNGICYLDEFDKLPKEVQGCLHGPMEQGVVEQSKMGSVNQSLAARTSILGSMNPKMGRFDDFDKKYVNQIDIEAALLSRFDLIFAVTDTPEPETDRKTIQHIHKTIYNKSIDNDELLTPDFLRKYIHCAQKIKPVISEKINNKIIDWFLTRRKIEDYHIGYRHYEAIRRLTEARARSRLATIANDTDAERAIELFDCSLDTLGVKDIDSILTGITTSEKRILQAVEGVLPCYWNDILGYGYKEHDIQVLIDKDFLFKGKDSKIYLQKVVE